MTEDAKKHETEGLQHNIRRTLSRSSTSRPSTSALNVSWLDVDAIRPPMVVFERTHSALYITTLSTCMQNRRTTMSLQKGRLASKMSLRRSTWDPL